MSTGRHRFRNVAASDNWNDTARALLPGGLLNKIIVNTLEEQLLLIVRLQAPERVLASGRRLSTTAGSTGPTFAASSHEGRIGSSSR